MPETSSSLSRFLRVVLVVSLALNLLVAGMVAGRLMGHDERQPRGVDLSLGPFTRALDDTDRRAIRDHLRDGHHRPPGRKARAQQNMALLAAIRAQPFAPEAVAAELEKERSIATALIRAGHEALLARLSNASDAERQAFADRLEAEFTKRDKRSRSRQ